VIAKKNGKLSTEIENAHDRRRRQCGNLR
jgi:hypothetical protein